jgi:hypothetical protein
MSNLEKRISAALGSDSLGSAHITDLIAEVERAAAAADQTATQERERALDLVASPDVAKAHEAVAVAELTSDRLRAVLPRLQQRLVEANDREYDEGWTAEYERVAVLRDEAAKEFARYSEMVGELVKIFRRAEEVEQEVGRVNRSAPSGELRRLRGVELTARGLEAFSSANPAISKLAQFPD